MVQRLTLRRRLSYNTRSNKRRIVRTPGGRLVYQYVKKNKTVPRCGQCKEKLKGITPSRPSERPRMSKRLKTVARTYGGVLCHGCLRERIVRAFLIEEQKIVKALKSQREALVKPVKAPKVEQKKKPTGKPTKPGAGKAGAKSTGPKGAAGAKGAAGKKPGQKPAVGKPRK
ncbi:60S ribosomal protein L34 [Drosophila madeirensis]|uniref:Large ribosomal subunit protein eL34 n=2 Tax=obscura subgroup TaxID=32357 RepID=A0A3B0JK54_DROGU|nr:60S ribosomal protein L34 [Drosophila guanche]XP_034662504.1 60S ribosomal protein L34 [Drosophila subobscura]SPP81173.1 blast:60S ribosomal protein L34 [Drosophila guanche]